MKVTTQKTADHCLVEVANDSGMTAVFSSLGASIRDIKVPDRTGESKTVTLCPVDEERNRNGYYGKTIGRTSGRIEGASFEIDGRRANLEKNNGGCDNLHGGKSGLHAKVFDCNIAEYADYTDVVFEYFSPDGEGGYFGNVNIKITYRVYSKENRFKIFYDCTSDCKTLLNLTNHVYWNLSGNMVETNAKDLLYINADKYCKLNDRLIIDGVVPVTPHMDFRTPHAIGDYIEEPDVQMYTRGYDHPYALNTKSVDETACTLESLHSGIKLEVRTSYPFVVFYSDCQANGKTEFYNGVISKKYLGVCLECQYHSDGTHHGVEKCGIIDENHPYKEEVEYIFTVV